MLEGPHWSSRRQIHKKLVITDLLKQRFSVVWEPSETETPEKTTRFGAAWPAVQTRGGAWG